MMVAMNFVLIYIETNENGNILKQCIGGVSSLLRRAAMNGEMLTVKNTCCSSAVSVATAEEGEEGVLLLCFIQ